MPNAYPKSKSPMMLSALIGVLIISTLMTVSYYFLSPGVENNLKHQIVKSLNKYQLFNAVVSVEGRDVVLRGIAQNESDANKLEMEIKNISGIHKVDSKLLIKNQTID